MNRRELERVLDSVWQRWGRSRRFSRVEFADIAIACLDREVEVDEVSRALQSYRTISRRRYDISAQTYGRVASWGVLGVHNHASTRRREVAETHAAYTIEDALRREMRDLAFEVLPALRRNGMSKAELQIRANARRASVYQRLVENGVEGDQLVAKVTDIFEPVDAFLREVA